MVRGLAEEPGFHFAHRVPTRRGQRLGRLVRYHGGNALRRAVIVGAGEAGAVFVKRILASPKMLMDPSVVVDDNANPHGNRLHGVPIVGPVSELPAIAERFRADEIIIAIPSATTEQMAHI